MDLCGGNSFRKSRDFRIVKSMAVFRLCWVAELQIEAQLLGLSTKNDSVQRASE